MEVSQLILSTYHSIYSHVEKPSWSYNIEKPVNVLKNCNHHFIFVFRCWSTMINRQCNTTRYFLCDVWYQWQKQVTYLSSGWVQGWMIPFISKYRLSNSTSFGLGLLASTGIFTPLHSFGYEEVIISSSLIVQILKWQILGSVRT